jgi:hypothetical protein
MATPKPGEIRCPTCHRSTPPAAFCTQCGSAIPSDARIRPRGMDRDELQDRIRARRSGGEPYRRGGPAEERGYERYEPDPADTQARRSPRAEQRRRDLFDDEAAAAAAPLPEPEVPSAPEPDWRTAERPPDITRDRDEWAQPAAPVMPMGAPPVGSAVPPPSDVPVEDAYAEPVEHPDNFDDEAYREAYAYDDWEEPRERGSGAGAFAILGFLALGVLALAAGAVLAGVFGGAPVGGGPTPTPSASLAPTTSAQPSESAGPTGSAAPSGSPDASGGPVVFPDGFTAEAQPCLPGSAGGSGCDSNGVSNNGVVDIWVGFENGNANDVVGATLVSPDGSTADGSIDLARIGCAQRCNGWTYFPFRNLTPGTYEVRITRNGDPAGTTTFEVTG